MLNKINGIENEFQFVKYLNNKKINELNPIFRELFDDLFLCLNNNDIVSAWKNNLPQKTDFFIKVNHVIKRISLKIGSKNSVHVEPISEFIHFLICNEVKKDAVIEYLKYHYADGTTNGKGCTRLSSVEYKEFNQDKLDMINKEINKIDILKNSVYRFVLMGTNSDIPIDALISGSINDFIWIKKDEIIDIIVGKNNKYSTGIHFGALSCQPMDRCLNRNPLYESRRYCIQIKWFNLFDEIIEYKNNNIN
ncbi:MAG: hypothetical protein RSB41_03445 [Bacilli bacterium]